MKADNSPHDTTSTSDGSSTPAGNQRRKRTNRTRPQLLKRYTFQEMSANTYAVNNLEYDLAGEVVLSPTTKAAFAFRQDSTASSKASPGPTELNVNLTDLI